MLTAIDGQVNGGGGVDKFRIKIWDSATGQVIYDNQPACGTQGGKPLFLPNDLITRAWGAYLIVQAKDLPLTP